MQSQGVPSAMGESLAASQTNKGLKHMSTDTPTQKEAVDAAREVLGLTTPEAFIETFPKLWRLVLGDPPNARQILIWLRQHPAYRMLDALNATAKKAEKLSAEENREMTQDHAIRFFSSVANSKKTEEDTMITKTLEETPSTPSNPFPRLDSKYAKPEPKVEPQAPLTPNYTEVK